jgi:hypothetical protein
MRQLFLIGIFLSLSACAIGNSSFGEGKELNKEIKKNINYPEFAKQAKLHGIVMVHFVVNSEGQLEVKDMNASDGHLAKYVKEQLENIQIAVGAAEGDHYVKFRFRYV